MFEITYSDNETFEAYQNAGKAHKGGTYDFTFENRYIIYHANLRHKVDYIAIDMSTGLASFVITKNPGNLYTEASYKRLIPHILYSVKYTGDMRYLNRFADDPLTVIDSIFRVVLPNNGYNIREEQIYQKTYRDTIVPFKQSKNRGEEDMYYATGTHASIIEKETFDKAQVLLQKRKEQFTKSITFNTYLLTSRIRCSECGSFYRRKVRSGGVKWVCAKHEENTKSCNSNYYSEERIYDGFLSVVNKLRFGQENILGQVIAKLESATQKYKRNNKTAMQISQKIAEINATILKLNELRSKGYLAPEIHQSQVREMQKQLCTLKEDRQDQFESRILTMLQDVRKLKTLIDEIDEPLYEFDEKLFEEIIVEMALNNADELTVTLLGGLKFTELI